MVKLGVADSQLVDPWRSLEGTEKPVGIFHIESSAVVVSDQFPGTGSDWLPCSDLFTVHPPRDSGGQGRSQEPSAPAALNFTWIETAFPTTAQVRFYLLREFLTQQRRAILPFGGEAMVHGSLSWLTIITVYALQLKQFSTLLPHRYNSTVTIWCL